MKTPKQMWLLYQPAECRESSEVPVLICPDEATAVAYKDTINGFINKLANRLPDTSSEYDADIWQVKWDKRQCMIGKARWPYGIKFEEYDLKTYGEVVQVKPVPFKGCV